MIRNSPPTGAKVAETKVTDRFWELDLRAKVASDSDTLMEASEHLGHADTGITAQPPS